MKAGNLFLEKQKHAPGRLPKSLSWNALELKDFTHEIWLVLPVLGSLSHAKQWPASFLAIVSFAIRRRPPDVP